MSILTSLILAGCLVSLAACSSEPPKPVLPDGLHRVPVNRAPPVSESEPVPDRPAIPDSGDRS
ncbi:hypothetical protein DR64_3924 [Paraburkholderia xenovorans LB400]|uniref:Lipoprotein n=1 Tax=Paraburkholderia tropica TaxID=92647 RepID=A0ABX5ME50_9BURK|nr:hypothetical protein DR64_3924 [Paraburkholderia xenovorans LB400]PXX07174.1 hypothetical protein C7400_13143 [Paraburkholderia tropica]PZW72710.1 hypothetical protein C7399_13142 [Paraburkholderia tropica]